jgi:hypothetical protein
MNLDDAVRLVLRALRDQAAGVGRKETIIVSQVEPLESHPAWFDDNPTGMYSRGLSVFPVFSTRLRHPARTGFLTPVVLVGALKSSPL